jgi:hypothetical protein
MGNKKSCDIGCSSVVDLDKNSPYDEQKKRTKDFPYMGI